MLEKAKLSVSTNKKGVNIGNLTFENGKSVGVPPSYKLDKSFDGKEVEVLRESGQVKKILLDGKELPTTEKKEQPKAISTKGYYNNSQISNNSQNVDSLPPDSFDKTKTKLPKDTRELNITKIDNFALKLNKAVRFDAKDKAEFFKKGRNGIEFKIKPYFGDTNFQGIIKRQENTIKAFVKELKSTELKNDWKMVIGLGETSVYETSMTLHHIYGIPYIPASTIKGVTRSWIISERFDNNEDKALQNEDFCLLFGSPKKSALGESQGLIVFFDAFPTEKPNIQPDIMNPHFGDYYQGNKPPVDYLSPVPIPFLTLKETSFKIFVGTNNNISLKDFPNTKSENILDLALEWLVKALTEHGIGAKTAVGYGYMDTCVKPKTLIN
jgi:CRISPR-associated protein Cmr6